MKRVDSKKRDTAHAVAKRAAENVVVKKIVEEVIAEKAAVMIAETMEDRAPWITRFSGGAI